LNAALVITFVDLTERKLMEERLRSLANEAADRNGQTDDHQRGWRAT